MCNGLVINTALVMTLCGATARTKVCIVPKHLLQRKRQKGAKRLFFNLMTLWTHTNYHINSLAHQLIISLAHQLINTSAHQYINVFF